MNLIFIIAKVIHRDILLFFRRILTNHLKSIIYQNKKKRLQNFVSISEFYFRNEDFDLITNYYKHDIVRANRIITNANQICNHVFDILGSGKINLGKNIDWCYDFKNNYKWEKKFYKKISIVNKKISDIKIPWELSRFYHLITLGKAYLISNNIKYYEEFKGQILSWIEQNPLEYSVNWTCSMEVAIRATNWIFAYREFENCLLKDKDFKNILDISILEHGEFIFRNLEKSLRGRKNANHYISNLVGLVFIGLHFKGYKKCNRWLNFALKEFNVEIESQIKPDGVHFETSTGYHRLVLEQLLFVQILLEKNGYSFNAKSKLLLKRMCDFIYNITNVDGDCHLVGDNDSGRLFILEDYYEWSKIDFSTCLILAYICFDIKEYVKQTMYCDEISLLIKPHQLIQIDKFHPLITTSKAYENGGFYLLRNKNFNCLIRCGNLSECGGGHSHNDQLSFTLFVNDISFFVDPGTYVYTSDKYLRNKFRSTSMHNTLCFNGIEQNQIISDKLFNLTEQTFAKCVLFNENLFEGYHLGYKNKLGIIHQRKISLNYNSITCEDKWDKSNHQYYNQYSILILNDEIIVEEMEKRIILKKESTCLKLSLNDYFIEETFISKGYGIINKTKVIKYRDDSLTITLMS